MSAIYPDRPTGPLRAHRRNLAAASLLALIFLTGCAFDLRAIVVRVGPPRTVTVEASTEVQEFLAYSRERDIADNVFFFPHLAAEAFPQSARRVPVRIRCGLVDDGRLVQEAIGVVVDAGFNTLRNEVAVFFEETGESTATHMCSDEQPEARFTIVLVVGNPEDRESVIMVRAGYQNSDDLLNEHFSGGGFLGTNPLVASDELELRWTDGEDGYRVPGY